MAIRAFAVYNPRPVISLSHKWSRRRNPLPFARILALAALLSVVCLQVQELAHGHYFDGDDSYAQCLTCKGSGAPALAPHIAPMSLAKSRPSGAPLPLPALDIALVSVPQPRGPPAIS